MKPSQNKNKNLLPGRGKGKGGVEIYFHSFVTSVLDAGQW